MCTSSNIEVWLLPHLALPGAPPLASTTKGAGSCATRCRKTCCRWRRSQHVLHQEASIVEHPAGLPNHAVVGGDVLHLLGCGEVDPAMVRHVNLTYSSER